MPQCGEWKQAVHYLGGETNVTGGEFLEVLVSISPRFTLRMLQQSPFSVVAPDWVVAPPGATLPVLPYHFLMLTDVERLSVLRSALRDALRRRRRQLERLGPRRIRVLDAGAGSGLLGLAAALEGCEVWLCEAAPPMRRLCREMLAAHAQAVAERNGLAQLLPAVMSTQLQRGRDGIPVEGFDIVISEVLDIWGLGEGVIPTMRHAAQSLLLPDGQLLPERIAFFARPVEVSLFGDAERTHHVRLSALAGHFHAKYSPLRVNQFRHKWLTEEPLRVLDIDFRRVPCQPQPGEANLEGVELCVQMGGKPALGARISSTVTEEAGLLTAYCFWWEADLLDGHVLTNAPSSAQRSWKQIVRWCEPRFVKEQEELQLMACYNEYQVNIDEIQLPAMDSSVPESAGPSSAQRESSEEIGPLEEDDGSFLQEVD